jgi:hypothetical protein
MNRVTRVLLFCLTAAAMSSAAFAQNEVPQNGWLDVNFAGGRSSQGAETVTFTSRVFSETAAAAASYPTLPNLKGVDFNAGFRLPGGAGKPIGIGVHFDNINYQQIADLGVRIPHPFFFNRPGAAAGISDVLTRKDRSLDIQATFIPPTPAEWNVRLFGGPSYIHMEEERVGAILYSQVATIFGTNFVAITSAPVETVDGSAWGLNAGADVAFFFSRYVGVGGTLRLTRGTVTLVDPLSNVEMDRDASHVIYGAGVRFRY